MIANFPAHQNVNVATLQQQNSKLETGNVTNPHPDLE
jgi:hypothetical protein